MTTYADPDTTRHMQAFEKAAKGVQALLKKLAKGQGDAAPLYRALNRLEDRAYKAEIRGDEAARDLAYRIIGDLRSAVTPAKEAGAAAVRAARDVELRALNEKIKASRPLPGSYEHELGMMRVRSDAAARERRSTETEEEKALLRGMGIK